jgi:hypothetical protein
MVHSHTISGRPEFERLGWVTRGLGWGTLGGTKVPTAVWRRVWRNAAIVVGLAICLARATGLAWKSAADFNDYSYADLGQRTPAPAVVPIEV